MLNNANQLTLSDIDSCDFGSAKAAQAVVPLPPKLQQSAPDFVFNTPALEQNNARMCWRILIQVVAMQINEMKSEPQPEPILWQERISDTLRRVNEKGRQFRPEFLPSDIVPPTAAYRALSVTGNWCDALTQELSCIFSSVPKTADTLKIELFPLDAVLSQRKDDTASINNVSTLLEVVTT